MAKYKNMTNRPLPVELIGRSLSVKARGEFDALPHEVSPQLRSKIGRQVRVIEPDVLPVSETEQKTVEGKGTARSLEPIPELAVLNSEFFEPQIVPDKKEDKGDDSLTTGSDLVESEEEEVPPMSARSKRDRDHKSRDKGGR